jgi:hypothetical protein
MTFKASRPGTALTNIRRYGACSACGRGRVALADCGVARSPLAGYVAGIIYRWDLRRPSLPGPGCPWRCPMAAATASTALVPVQPAFTDAERLALAGYLAGYRGLTREAYTLDLRQFTSWCRTRSLPLFSVRRVDIETFARELEARGRARAAVTRRLSTIAGFCKHAEGELLDHSPAAHVRRPRLDYESTAAPVRTGSVTHGKSPSICQLSAMRAFSFAEAIELGQDDCGGGLGELGAELKCGGAFGVAEAPGDGVDVHPCGAMTGAISLRAARAADYNGFIAVVDDWWGTRSIAHCRGCSSTIFTTRASSPSVPAASSPVPRRLRFPGSARLRLYPVRGGGAGGAEKPPGQLPYRAFFEMAANDGRRVVRAVTAPVNSASIAFRAAMGFTVTGPSTAMTVRPPPRCSSSGGSISSA